MGSWRRSRILAQVVVACVLALSATARAQGAAPSQYSETKERLDTKAMEALVAEPMALARGGDWPAAQRAFERLLAERQSQFGADSVKVSDTVEAFVILNFVDGRQIQALAYADLERASVRRAWGHDSLEYALALNDLAQMDFEHNKPGFSASALADLREAYRIRRSQLGRHHKETVSTLIYIGRLQSQRSITHGDIRRAAPAIATLRQAIAETESDRAASNNDNLWARAVLAETYARNGALPAATREYDRLVALAERQGVPANVYDIAFASALDDGGYSKEAEALMKRFLKSVGAPLPGAASAANAAAAPLTPAQTPPSPHAR